MPGGREFRRDTGGWVLDLPRPTALHASSTALPWRAGTTSRWCSTRANPRTVATAFGERSVMEIPGYAPPWWLSAPAAPGRLDR